MGDEKAEQVKRQEHSASWAVRGFGGVAVAGICTDLAGGKVVGTGHSALTPLLMFALACAMLVYVVAGRVVYPQCVRTEGSGSSTQAAPLNPRGRTSVGAD